MYTTNIEGLTVDVSAERLIVASERPLRTVTTAPYGAEFREVRAFLSLPATAEIDCDRPDRSILERAAAHGVAGPLAGFLTAVKLTRAVVALEADEDCRVTVVATVGVTNASRPGEERVGAYTPGTINTIVVIDGDLSPNALNEALTTTAEAKALAVYEAGVLTAGGRVATGTSTDAYAVACTGAGMHHRYAGSVAPVGYLTGKAVRRAITEGLGPAMERMAKAAAR